MRILKDIKELLIIISITNILLVRSAVIIMSKMGVPSEVSMNLRSIAMEFLKKLKDIDGRK